MQGKGHFADWEKRQAEMKARSKPLSIASRLKQRKQKKFMGQGSKKKGGVEERPTYFDLEPFKLALKKFLRVDARARVRVVLMCSRT